MQKEKILIKNTLIFMMGNLGSKLIMLFAVPLYTFYLSTEEMGAYDILYMTVELLKPLVILSIFEGVYRWLLDQQYDKLDVLRNGFSVAAVCLVIVNAFFLVIYLLIPVPHAFVMLLLLNTSCLYLLLQYTTRGLKNALLFSIQGIVYAATMLVASIILVCWLRLGYVGLLWSVVSANTVAILLMVIRQLVLFRIKEGRRDPTMQGNMIRYSAMLIPNAVNWWIMNASSRYIIVYFLGEAANGIYAIAYKFPSFVQMLSTVFYQAWQEQAIEEYSSEERNAYYSRVYAQYYMLLFTGIIVLIPATRFLIEWFIESSYHDASKYVPILYIASVFSALASFYGTGYLSTKNTKGAMSTTVLGAIINLLIGLGLIRIIGIYAVLLSTMLANMVVLIARIVQTRAYFTIRVDWVGFFGIISISSIYGLLVNYVSITSNAVLLFVGIMIFVFFNRRLIQGMIGMMKQKMHL